MTMCSTAKTHLAAALLVFLTASCVGCAGPLPAAPQQSPAATAAGDCGRLGDLAPVCGKTFTATRIDGGSTDWAVLPALQLTLAATPEGVPYVTIKTGVNNTMTPVDVTSDRLIPTGKTAMSLVGPGSDMEGKAESAREQWVIDFTADTIQWSLSTDRSQLTLKRGTETIVASTKA